MPSGVLRVHLCIWNLSPLWLLYCTGLLNFQEAAPTYDIVGSAAAYLLPRLSPRRDLSLIRPIASRDLDEIPLMRIPVRAAAGLLRRQEQGTFLPLSSDDFARKLIFQVAQRLEARFHA
ncbi:hypothetical protein C8R45DRAFT_930080 [Mycena sanguinolenta]|nr:hypothetical protein C8R45DRAFT_930080 [Mycena sanguinolenta]